MNDSERDIPVEIKLVIRGKGKALRITTALAQLVDVLEPIDGERQTIQEFSANFLPPPNENNEGSQLPHNHD